MIIQTSDRQATIRRHIGTALVILILAVVAILVLLPVLWTFSTSLRVSNESFDLPPKWLPTDFQVQNYVEVFNRVPFGRYILNSLIPSNQKIISFWVYS